MKLKIFCRCSLFPSWSGSGLISASVAKRHLPAESCDHRRTGRPKLDCLDFMTDVLTGVGVRNSRSREVKVKVKHSHCRPGVAQRVPGSWGSQISRQLAHEGGKVVRPTHRPPLPPRKYSWYSFLLEAESTPGP